MSNWLLKFKQAASIYKNCVVIMENTEVPSEMNNVIIVTDSDDDSLEYVKPSRKSCGNYTLMLESLKMTDINTRAPLKTYEERLEAEIKEWSALLKSTLKATVDKSTATIRREELCEENRKYLDAAPSLQLFLSESVKFRERADLFFRHDYSLYKGICDQLVEVADEIVQTRKVQLCSKRLAKANK